MAASLLWIGRAGSLKLQRWGALTRSPMAALTTDGREPKTSGKKAVAATVEASDEQSSQLSNKTVVAFPSKIVLPGVPPKQALGDSALRDDSGVTKMPGALAGVLSTVQATAENKLVNRDDTSKADAGAGEPGTASDEGESSSSSSDSDSGSDSDSDDEREEVKAKPHADVTVDAEKEALSQDRRSAPASSQAHDPGPAQHLRVLPNVVSEASPDAAVIKEISPGMTPTEVSHKAVRSSGMKAAEEAGTDLKEAWQALEDAPSVRDTSAVLFATSEVKQEEPYEDTTTMSSPKLEDQVPASVTLAAASEQLADAAPLVAEATGADIQPEAEAAESPQGSAQMPPEPEPFDNTTYKNLQHHQYHTYTFTDMEVEMAKYRLAQPSSGRH